MSRGPQFGRRAGAGVLLLTLRRGLNWPLLPICAAAVVALTLGLAGPLGVRADQAQGIIGHIQGGDASVETTSTTSDTIVSADQGTDVSNGSIISVHTGQAHMTLTAGGEVDVCGPAKFTVLQSGGAITLALDFGRVRVQLPASADLRIFTPTIIATPIDINGTARDITTGLDLDDSLCVTAGSGALLLENQFTGEKLVVPQGGDFSLAQGKLVPVAGVAGACQCVMLQTKVIIPPPEPTIGLTAPAHVDLPTNAAAAPKPPAPADSTPAKTLAKSNVEYSVLGYVNQVRPTLPPPKPAPQLPPPATETPEYKVVMPPLTYSAASPEPPPDPAPNMILLIRTVHVEPEWEFSGHVNAPSVDAKSKEVANVSKAKPQPEGAQPAPQKKEGFWAKFKRFVKGSNS